MIPSDPNRLSVVEFAPRGNAKQVRYLMGFEAAIELIEQRCFQVPAGKIVYTDEKDGLIDFERFIRLEKKLS